MSYLLAAKPEVKEEAEKSKQKDSSKNLTSKEDKQQPEDKTKTEVKTTDNEINTEIFADDKKEATPVVVPKCKFI